MHKDTVSRAMFVPLVLFIFMTVISSSTAAISASGGAPKKTVELGKAIDLRGTNLLADFQERERTIFEPFDSACFRSIPLKSSRKFMEYYANNNAFYSSLATQSELDVSLQSSYTLGVSLNVATQGKSSKTNKVSGMSLNAMTINEKILVRRGCLEGDGAKLKSQFLSDLELLPVTVVNPWQSNSWSPYRNFLRKFGSHVINSVSLGSSFKQMTFAESEKSYSERDFKVKSCVSLVGAGASIKGCTDISQSEKSEASRMSTSDKVFVLGGNADTRNKLLYHVTRSAEQIQKLLNEANESPSSIKHTFLALWKVLQTRFPYGSPNHVRGLNLEYYYLGFLNYGCTFITSGGVQIQKFDYTKSSMKTSPEFECSLAKEGCHSDDDCHYKPIWCSCYGNSCVRYKSIPQDNGANKQTAYPNHDEDWDWSGCDWYAAGSYCNCYNKNREFRKVVWSRPNKDAAERKTRIQGGHVHREEKDVKG